MFYLWKLIIILFELFCLLRLKLKFMNVLYLKEGNYQLELYFCIWLLILIGLDDMVFLYCNDLYKGSSGDGLF